MCIKCYEIYIALHSASNHAQLDEKSTSKLLLKAWNIDHSLRTSLYSKDRLLVIVMNLRFSQAIAMCS